MCGGKIRSRWLDGLNFGPRQRSRKKLEENFCRGGGNRILRLEAYSLFLLATTQVTSRGEKDPRGLQVSGAPDPASAGESRVPGIDKTRERFAGGY